jgi:MFS transporter, DHA2 family, multidrug resistance protein
MSVVANEPSPAGLNRGLITISVILASFLQALDQTIANVALPHIGGELSATQEQISWVLTSYIVAAAIMIPVTGWLADRYGRKKVLVLSVIGFTVSSALCGVAQSLGQIVLFRFLQGLGGAALVPQSQAVLLDINPPERQGRAMAVWVLAVVVGPAVGPVLGGWLTDNYSWRWVFFINIPFGVLAVLGLLSSMRESHTRPATFDFFGFATLSLAVGAFQVMLDRGQLQDWFSSTEICVEAALAAVAFYVFMVHTVTARNPFVNPGLFRDRNFDVGCVAIFTFGVVLFSTLALLPPLLQDLMGYPVVTTGWVTAPRGVGILIATLVTGRLIARVDTRLLIAAGIALTAASTWAMCGFSPLMDDRLVMWSGFIQGLGIGLSYAPLTTVSFATLSPQFRSGGTSMFNLLRNVGSSIGISTVQALLTRNTQIMHSRLGEHITLFGGQLRPAAPYSFSTPHGLAALDASVTRQAEMIAYNNDFKLLLVLCLAIMPLVLLLSPRRPGAGDAPVIME